MQMVLIVFGILMVCQFINVFGRSTTILLHFCRLINILCFSDRAGTKKFECPFIIFHYVYVVIK